MGPGPGSGTEEQRTKYQATRFMTAEIIFHIFLIFHYHTGWHSTRARVCLSKQREEDSLLTNKKNRTRRHRQLDVHKSRGKLFISTFYSTRFTPFEEIWVQVGLGSVHPMCDAGKRDPRSGGWKRHSVSCTTHKIIINRNATSYLAACHNCCESAIYPPHYFF